MFPALFYEAFSLALHRLAKSVNGNTGKSTGITFCIVYYIIPYNYKVTGRRMHNNWRKIHTNQFRWRQKVIIAVLVAFTEYHGNSNYHEYSPIDHTCQACQARLSKCPCHLTLSLGCWTAWTGHTIINIDGQCVYNVSVTVSVVACFDQFVAVMT